VLLHHRQTSFPTAPETGVMGVFVTAMASDPVPPEMTCTPEESPPVDLAATQVTKLCTQSSQLS